MVGAYYRDTYLPNVLDLPPIQPVFKGPFFWIFLKTLIDRITKFFGILYIYTRETYEKITTPPIIFPEMTFQNFSNFFKNKDTGSVQFWSCAFFDPFITYNFFKISFHEGYDQNLKKLEIRRAKQVYNERICFYGN